MVRIEEEVPGLLLSRPTVLLLLRDELLLLREEDDSVFTSLRDEGVSVFTLPREELPSEREEEIPESLFPRPLFPLLRVDDLSLLREEVLPARLLLLSEREDELSPRVEMLLSRVPGPFSDSLRLGALVVVRLPVARSVVVMVLLLRSLVMRFPLRSAGLLRTVEEERGAVTRPTSGRLSYW